jgi:hypothetical protein
LGQAVGDGQERDRMVADTEVAAMISMLCARVRPLAAACQATMPSVRL